MIASGDVTTHTAASVAARAAAAARNPSPAQVEAGNYRKPKIWLHGLRISIENPKGTTRSGTAPDGTRWESTMTAHYGYVGGTKGPDGDHVDVFLGPDPASEKVFVVDQVDPETGKFDEHKAILGCNSQQEARRLYLSNYEPGWMGLGAITPMPMASFKAFCQDREAQQHPLALPWATDSTYWTIDKREDSAAHPTVAPFYPASDARRGIQPAGPGEYPCNSCGGAYGEDEACAQCGAMHERADDPVPMDGETR